MTTTDNDCVARDYKPLPVPLPSGYLANWVTKETKKGSGSCPWQVTAKPGQWIQLTLLDFGVWGTRDPNDPDVGQRDPPSGGNSPQHSGICHIYARIREGSSSSITLCGGEAREKIVYVSEGHEVEIEVTNPRSAPDPAFYIIKYERKFGTISYFHIIHTRSFLDIMICLQGL